MVNLRTRSKARRNAPRAALKRESTVLVLPTASEGRDTDLSEVALRKLPRGELQKVAIAHRVKANMKTETIIGQLVKLRKPEDKRRARSNGAATGNAEGLSPGPTEDNHEEGPSRKRVKGATSPNEVVPSEVVANHRADDRTVAVAGPSAPPPTSPEHEPLTVLEYDKGLFSGTESEMSEEDQPDYGTPVSSRVGTPPPASRNDLERCVRIMREISAKDVALLNEVTETREVAAKLRKTANDIRSLVAAERGRRERMEEYFRYWQQISPRWDRSWIYGEEAKGKERQGPDASPTPDGRRAHGLAGLGQRRQAIVTRQEAEQRQLEEWSRQQE